MGILLSNVDFLLKFSKPHKKWTKINTKKKQVGTVDSQSTYLWIIIPADKFRGTNNLYDEKNWKIEMKIVNSYYTWGYLYVPYLWIVQEYPCLKPSQLPSSRNKNWAK